MKNRILTVPSVMMVTVKMPMRLFSVMGAISRYIKSAMESHSFQRDNGFAESVNSLVKAHLYVVLLPIILRIDY